MATLSGFQGSQQGSCGSYVIAVSEYCTSPALRLVKYPTIVRNAYQEVAGVQELQELQELQEFRSNRPIKTQRLFVAEIAAGAETEKRGVPPVSLR